MIHIIINIHSKVYYNKNVTNILQIKFIAYFQT